MTVAQSHPPGRTGQVGQPAHICMCLVLAFGCECTRYRSSTRSIDFRVTDAPEFFFIPLRDLPMDYPEWQQGE